MLLPIEIEVKGHERSGSTLILQSAENDCVPIR